MTQSGQDRVVAARGEAPTAHIMTIRDRIAPLEALIDEVSNAQRATLASLRGAEPEPDKGAVETLLKDLSLLDVMSVIAERMQQCSSMATEIERFVG